MSIFVEPFFHVTLDHCQSVHEVKGLTDQLIKNLKGVTDAVRCLLSGLHFFYKQLDFASQPQVLYGQYN